MGVFSESDYKKLIRQQVKEKQKNQASLTLRRVASQIPVQYTYLSKVLNNDSAHLNEDHLYRIAQLLDFDDEETEYFLLLRSYATTADSGRREFIQRKLESLRKDNQLTAKKVEAYQSRMSQEMKYLLDPWCVLVHVSLFIKEIQRDPRLLISRLQIKEEKLREILRTLEKADFVRLSSEDPYKVLELKDSHFHFGKEHPLMRTHQQLLKSAIQPRLQQTPEGDKHSFLATFTLAPADFEKIKQEFQEFIQRIEGIVRNSTQDGVYQISFDAFRWF